MKSALVESSQAPSSRRSVTNTAMDEETKQDIEPSNLTSGIINIKTPRHNRVIKEEDSDTPCEPETTYYCCCFKNKTNI